MVTAYIMCKIQAGMDDKVVAELIKLEQVQEAALTYGAYDLAIQVNFKIIEDLDKFLFDTIRRIEGITETSTMIVAKQIV